jgi:hypothetical protein
MFKQEEFLYNGNEVLHSFIDFQQREVTFFTAEKMRENDYHFSKFRSKPHEKGCIQIFSDHWYPRSKNLSEIDEIFKFQFDSDLLEYGFINTEFGIYFACRAYTPDIIYFVVEAKIV